MDSQRWRQLNDLFAAALDMPAAERSPFLAGACGGDSGLRREVESLLAAHQKAGDFIEKPALLHLAEAAAPPESGGPGSGPADELPDDLARGSRLGPYEVVALLGAGGMGRVYRARDPRLGREVAIKVLPRRALGDREQRHRFTQEARAAGSLNHPNLLAVYDVGAETEPPYVVTELLEGETLLARLRGGPLPVERAVDLGRQIAAGLAAAHAKGIVHRDLKPANLFVTLDGRLKILDFGLAKQTGTGTGAGAAALASGATRPGVVLGTVGYMSPEQVRGQPVDPRSDIFSFGAVLYEMLSGRRAFTGDSAVETMNAILTHEPPALGALGRAAPPDLERLLWRCLRKGRDERFASAGELAAALAAAARARGPVEAGTLIDLPRAGTGAGAGAGAGRPPGIVAAGQAAARGAAAAYGVAGAPQQRPGPRRRAIAVLPFQGLGADAADAHLGLGLADATITELAQVRSLVVRPTSAILRFTRAAPDAVEAGRELEVDTVVEGTFQRQGARLRISVRLLSVADRQALWGAKIDTSFDDLFRVQDEVSQAVSRALAIELTPGDERRRERLRRGEEPAAGEANELVLKGRVHLFGETLEEWLKAVDCFERARTLEPAAALAWAGLADVYSRIAFTYLPEGDWYERAWAACDRALKLDPRLPEALYVRGGRLLWSPQAGFDHAGAMRDLVPAIADRPSLEEAHVRLGSILHHVGLIDEVEHELDQALLISPRHLLARQHQALCLFTRGRFQEALDLYQGVAGQAPSPWVQYQVALCQLRLGRVDDSAESVARMERQTPGELLTYPLRGLLAALRGDRAAALEAVAQTIRNQRSVGHFHHAQYDLACVHALLGDADQAVAWLHTTARNGFPCAPQFAGDAFLASLASHEGFLRLLRELEQQSHRYAALFRELRAACA